MKTELYNLENKSVGIAELPDEIFGVKWKPSLVHQIIESMRANIRQPWAHAKGRGVVRGGGKKPWRQKGTGRARHGSTRSPIWKGGGVSHGPLNERNYDQKINKKMRRAALFSALSKKLADQDLRVVEGLNVLEPKTKLANGMLNNFRDAKKQTSILVVPGKDGKNLFRATRNIQKTKAIDPSSLNVYDVMRHKIVLIDMDAVQVISKIFHA